MVRSGSAAESHEIPPLQTRTSHRTAMDLDNRCGSRDAMPPENARAPPATQTCEHLLFRVGADARTTVQSLEIETSFPAFKFLPHLLLLFVSMATATADDPISAEFEALVRGHCLECHDAGTRKGQLDLTGLPRNLADPEALAAWVKVHDRVAAEEMPPQPAQRAAMGMAGRAEALAALARKLAAADAARQERDGRSGLRRLSRVEFENALRDLLGLPGLRIDPDE